MHLPRAGSFFKFKKNFNLKTSQKPFSFVSLLLIELIFHYNNLPADDSHDMSSLIAATTAWRNMPQNVSSAADAVAVLRLV